MFKKEKGLARAFNYFLGGEGNGWNDAWGPEMVQRKMLPKVKYGSTVLDLCSGFGRISVPFALHGARVTIVDNNQLALQEARKSFGEVGLEDRLEQVICDDVKRLRGLNLGQFDFVVAGGAIVHMRKSEALTLINTLPTLMRNGGYVYIDAPSIESWSYDSLRKDAERVEPFTYKDWCECTGEGKMDNVTFVVPGEVEAALVSQRCKIIEAKSVQILQSGCYNWAIVAKK